LEQVQVQVLVVLAVLAVLVAAVAAVAAAVVKPKLIPTLAIPQMSFP
jgi:hypothetical protein